MNKTFSARNTSTTKTAALRPKNTQGGICFVKFFRFGNFRPKKGKELKKRFLTKEKHYAILLYCINMDKNPVSGPFLNRMNQIGFKNSVKEPEKTKVYPKNNLGFLPLRKRSPGKTGGVNKDRGD